MFALFLSTAMASPDSGLGNAINVSTSDAYALIESRPDMVVIDVRTPEEYQGTEATDGAAPLAAIGFAITLPSIGLPSSAHKASPPRML